MESSISEMIISRDVTSDETEMLIPGEMPYETTPVHTGSAKMSWMTLLFSSAILLLACTGDGAAPTFDISLKSAEDDVEVHLSDRVAAFLVTSSTGIGDVHITSSGGQWPDTIRVRLQYESGKGFHHLESFTVQTDSLLARTALGRPGLVPLYCAGTHTRIDSSAICGETLIPLVKKTDCIEAIIPQIFTTKETKRLTISWIDMYRN